MARDRSLALTAVAAGALLLAGCATTVAGPRGNCEAEQGQAFIGRAATATLGVDLLEATGARVVRWVAPRTVVTADYRPDRLTVEYDDEMTITRVVCG